MLELNVHPHEEYDSNTKRFVTYSGGHFRFEHNLVAIAKWESVMKKPFFSDSDLSDSDLLTYIECMSLDNISVDDINGFTKENFSTILSYMNDTHSATKLPKNQNGSQKAVTSEKIYYQMFACGLPLECENWFIYRLLATLSFFSDSKDNDGKRKATPQELSAIRAANRKAMYDK